jgi:hypothetical protein
MDEFLKSLKSKENELIGKLEESPLFIQLEAVRRTIAAFEGNGSNSIAPSVNGHSIPQAAAVDSNSYNASQFTWKDRVLFVIRQKREATLSEIISEIERLEPNKYGKAFLDKRVGVTVAQLKAKGILEAKKVDKKFRYYLP